MKTLVQKTGGTPPGKATHNPIALNLNVMATADIAPSPAIRTAQTPFSNEPFVDFSLAENKRAMEAALAKVQTELGREYDMIVGGRELKTEGKIRSVNPAKPSQVVGIHQRAEAEHA